MFLPENIDLAHSERYHLSIRLSPDGFLFSIHCPEDPSVFHFQQTGMGNKLSYVENIKKVIFDMGFFSQTFRQVNVTMVSPTYTFVPNEFYDRRQSQNLFDFNFHNAEGIVLSDFSPEQNVHILFNIDEELHAFLSRNLWNPSFRHHTSLLTRLYDTLSNEASGRNCFVDFHDGFVTLIGFEGRQLLSVNTFQASNPDDSAFFIASVWEKLSFDQSADHLLLSGNYLSQQSTVDLLRKLIRNVEVVQTHPKVILSKEEKQLLPTDIIAGLCA